MSDSDYKIRNQFGLHFLTFTVVGWVDLFTRKECRDIIIGSLDFCQRNKGLTITSYCIMGSHMHIIAIADESSDGLSAIIRDFKKFTAKLLLDWVFKGGKESRKEWLKLVFAYHAKYNRRNSNYQVWQQNNHPKECVHPKFTWQKINYIHNNPVEAGIVDKPEDYRYSSARNYAGGKDFLLEVVVLEPNLGIGYVMT